MEIKEFSHILKTQITVNIAREYEKNNLKIFKKYEITQYDQANSFASYVQIKTCAIIAIYFNVYGIKQEKYHIQKKI